MTRVHYRLICHYQTLAFWLRIRGEGRADGCQGGRVETRMKDDGGSEGRGKDEKAHRANRKRWSAVKKK